MPLYFHEFFLDQLFAQRIATIGGSFGSHKTSLAVRLAWELALKRSWSIRYVISNIRIVFGDMPSEVVLRSERFVDAVIILDEAGIFLKNVKDVEAFMAFTRKLNLFYLLPSVHPPSTRVQHLMVKPKYRLSAFGLPGMVYEYYSSSGLRDVIKSSFLWWNPSEVYGLYDTLAMPVQASAIAGWVNYWIGCLNAKHKFDIDSPPEIESENIPQSASKYATKKIVTFNPLSGSLGTSELSDSLQENSSIVSQAAHDEAISLSLSRNDKKSGG